MCGIVGWAGEGIDRATAGRMLAHLAHRGPDDSGEWLASSGGVWLGQRRLSIIDLSSLGHQPMASASQRYVITYNGEVYNYPELRTELEALGHAFRGHSDTEVMLAAFEAWGVEKAVAKFDGMFAFGLLDQDTETLWLGRDRLGKKPLYYACGAGSIAFASELSALWDLPWLDRRLDRDALHAYFRYLCVPAPASVVRGARKLPAGTLLSWRRGETASVRYWDIARVAAAAVPFTGSFEAAADELDGLLRDAVRLRLRSDVPYGAFLSGGIDSSLVVALMQQEAPQPVETFTIGFEADSHDEAPHARAVAAHLGTRHHEQVLGAREAAQLVPEIADKHDEPFADGSSVPTYLLSRFTRRHVTVALSGDGGDELFGGYPRYFWAERIERLQRRLTPRGARLAGRSLRAVPAALWDRLGPRRLAGSGGLSSRVARFAAYLECTPDEVYTRVVSAWNDPARLLGVPATEVLGPRPQRYGSLPWAARMMATDQEHYLVDDIMTKVDRMTMANSLEARAPLLDHRIVEWSWRLPLAYKLASRGDRGKLLLRAVLDRYVPRQLIDRPKMGFGMPMADWLRSELRDWAEGLLSERRLKESGVLDPAVVRREWQAHLDGHDRLSRLWTVLMFLQWQDKWRPTV